MTSPLTQICKDAEIEAELFVGRCRETSHSLKSCSQTSLSSQDAVDVKVGVAGTIKLTLINHRAKIDQLLESLKDQGLCRHAAYENDSTIPTTNALWDDAESNSNVATTESNTTMDSESEDFKGNLSHLPPSTESVVQPSNRHNSSYPAPSRVSIGTRSCDQTDVHVSVDHEMENDMDPVYHEPHRNKKKARRHSSTTDWTPFSPSVSPAGNLSTNLSLMPSGVVSRQTSSPLTQDGLDRSSPYGVGGSISDPSSLPSYQTNFTDRPGMEVVLRADGYSVIRFPNCADRKGHLHVPQLVLQKAATAGDRILTREHLERKRARHLVIGKAIHSFAEQITRFYEKPVRFPYRYDGILHNKTGGGVPMEAIMMLPEPACTAYRLSLCYYSDLVDSMDPKLRSVAMKKAISNTMSSISNQPTFLKKRNLTPLDRDSENARPKYIQYQPSGVHMTPTSKSPIRVV